MWGDYSRVSVYSAGYVHGYFYRFAQIGGFKQRGDFFGQFPVKTRSENAVNYNIRSVKGAFRFFGENGGECALRFFKAGFLREIGRAHV